MPTRKKSDNIISIGKKSDNIIQNIINSDINSNDMINTVEHLFIESIITDTFGIFWNSIVKDTEKVEAIRNYFNIDDDTNKNNLPIYYYGKYEGLLEISTKLNSIFESKNFKLPESRKNKDNLFRLLDKLCETPTVSEKVLKEHLNIEYDEFKEITKMAQEAKYCNIIRFQGNSLFSLTQKGRDLCEIKRDKEISNKPSMEKCFIILLSGILNELKNDKSLDADTKTENTLRYFTDNINKTLRKIPSIIDPLFGNEVKCLLYQLYKMKNVTTIRGIIKPQLTSTIQKESIKKQNNEEEIEYYANDTLKLVNEIRKKSGLSSLELDLNLMNTAKAYAEKLRESFIFAEQDEDDSSWNIIVKKNRVCFFGNKDIEFKTVNIEIQDYLNNSEYRVQILNKELKTYGAIAHKNKSDGSVFFLQIFNKE